MSAACERAGWARGVVQGLHGGAMQELHDPEGDAGFP